MVTGILAVVAEWEADVISERTSAALQQKQANGEHLGTVPYGFRLNGSGQLVEAPGEVAQIRRMKRWRRRGWSYSKIAERLNSEGVESRRGSWSKSSVHALVNDHLSSRKARYGVP